MANMCCMSVIQVSDTGSKSIKAKNRTIFFGTLV